MFDNLTQLQYDFTSSSYGYPAIAAETYRAGEPLFFKGTANDTNFTNRRRVGSLGVGGAMGVAAYDKQIGDTRISVITGQIWPILIDPATTDAALQADMASVLYRVFVNAQNKVVVSTAPGATAFVGNNGDSYTGLFITAKNAIVDRQASGDRYLLAQRYEP
jgi:hypothetical protein